MKMNKLLSCKILRMRLLAVAVITSSVVVTGCFSKSESTNNASTDVTELKVSVDTVTKKTRVRSLPNGIHYEADLDNEGFKNVKASLQKEKGILTITFDYETKTWMRLPGASFAWGPPHPFLIRVFDRTGNPVTFFTTKEAYIPDVIVQKVSHSKDRVYQWCQPGECPSKLFSNKLNAKENTLSYQINAHAADYAVGVEIGFDTNDVAGGKEIWRP